MFKQIFLILSLTLFQNIALADLSSESNDQSPRFAIHLLDYLAHDYGGAVEHGKVVSPSEYSEQQEFALKIYELGETLPEIKSNQKILEKIVKLKKMIDNKAEAIDVAVFARDIQKELISIANVALAPTEWPSLTNGHKLFQQNCISCHGIQGRGDGPAGAKMDPHPANFHKEERMSQISAFHSYNTIRLGVPGTGMASWNQFTDKEVWDLSFYLMSIRHEKTAASALAKSLSTPTNITLEEAAGLSDAELKEKLIGKDDNEKLMALALLRNKDNTPSGDQYIGKAKSLLDDTLVAYNKKTSDSKNDAKNLALRAYL